MRDNELILYRDYDHADIMENARLILSGEDDAVKTHMTAFAGSLVEMAVNHGYTGNLWQAYLTYIIANNENAFSTSCEMRGMPQGSVTEAAVHDLSIFREMFATDISEMDQICGTGFSKMLTEYAGDQDRSRLFNKRIRDSILKLRDSLATSKSDEDFAAKAAQFYGQFGVGKFGLFKAFRVEHEEGRVRIAPITNILHVQLEDLVGYESAKKKLVANTEAFLAGRPCNNCLLFGDAGTGKSSSIKGILNRYYDRGLRMIEIYKHQFRDLNDVIDQIKTRNYKFIIYMDDLSFEDFETDYKYLKAVIEGGLEKKPENILIYATSNRRHIVREKNSDKNDRDEDLHSNDTVQEKLSLSYRFGETIYFGRPDKKQFNEIVKAIAARSDLHMDEEELLLEANKWELSHGGLSGRCAQQFINYMLSGE